MALAGLTKCRIVRLSGTIKPLLAVVGVTPLAAQSTHNWRLAVIVRYDQLRDVCLRKGDAA